MLQWKSYTVSSWLHEKHPGVNIPLCIYHYQIYIEDNFWIGLLHTQLWCYPEWVHCSLHGAETRNIQSWTVRLDLYKHKPKIFKHNFLIDGNLPCRQMLTLDDACRLLKTCAAVAACNSEGWPLQSTMSTATETQGGGGHEPFHWDHKLAESHWHSESYTIIIKQLCHSLLCPFSPTAALSYSLHFPVFFFLT